MQNLYTNNLLMFNGNKTRKISMMVRKHLILKKNSPSCQQHDHFQACYSLKSEKRYVANDLIRFSSCCWNSNNNPWQTIKCTLSKTSTSITLALFSHTDFPLFISSLTRIIWAGNLLISTWTGVLDFRKNIDSFYEVLQNVFVSISLI